MFGYFGLLEPYVNSHKIIEEDKNRGALWLGDYKAALDKVELKNKGIKTVISVVSGIDFKYDKGSQITHQIFWVHDSPDQNISQFFDETYNNIEIGLQKGSVLVHCFMGISRSSSIVIAYMMRRFKFSHAYAYNFVKRKRVIICPNFGFSRQLKEFENTQIKNQSLYADQNKHAINDLGPLQLNSRAPSFQYPSLGSSLEDYNPIQPVYTEIKPITKNRARSQQPESKIFTIMAKPKNIVFQKMDSSLDSAIEYQNETQIIINLKPQKPNYSEIKSVDMGFSSQRRQKGNKKISVGSTLPYLNIVSFNAQKGLILEQKQKNQCDFIVEGKFYSR